RGTDTRREGDDPGAEAIARVAWDLLDDALLHEGAKQARGRALWKRGPLGDVRDADGPVGKRQQDGKRSFNRLDSRHARVNSCTLATCVPLYGTVPQCGTGMADQDQDIDLNALPDDELTEQMHNDLYDGLADEITEGTNILLGRGWSPDRV